LGVEQPAAPILRIDRLVVAYGAVEILHGIDISVFAGEIVSIIGPNGAGKSTVLKSVMGFLKPRNGAIRLGQTDITGLRPDVLVRQGIGYVAQGRVVFPRMTVDENLEMGAYSMSDKRRRRQITEHVFTLFPRLAERRYQLAATLSGGEQQMLAIGRGLMTEPRLLLMDEPSLGLAPRFIDLVFDTVQELRKHGPTVVLVEQNAARALAISDRAYVLDLGRNRFTGSGRELLDDPRVRELYLGGRSASSTNDDR
jgi:ABC-type branched-subunit amino acid transport system ATPase component